MLQVADPVKLSVIAHRGVSSNNPDNTRRAFTDAVACGADGIELDIHITADDQLVICHNPTLDHYGHPDAVVAKSTLAELKSLDIGRSYGSAFVGEQLLTLDEVLDEFGDRIPLLVELKSKYMNSREIDRLVRRFLAVTHPNRDKFQLQALCFRPSVLRLLHESASWLPLVWNTNFADRLHPFDLANKPWLTAVSCRIEKLHGSVTDLIHQAGFQLYCFTCNDEAEVLKARDLGASIIMSDDPMRTRGILANHAGSQNASAPTSAPVSV